MLGSCRIRRERGEFPCTAPICDAYVPRGGALDAKGRSTNGANVALNIARQSGNAPRTSQRARPAPILKQRIPDGPAESSR